MTDAAIFADIDRRRQDLIGLARHLIRIPTLNLPGRNYRAIGDCLGERLLADYVVSPGAYDQKHSDRIGWLKNCIACGPGLLHLAQQPDEWVDVQSMTDSAKVMALVLGDLLGSPARMDQPPAAWRSAASLAARAAAS